MGIHTCAETLKGGCGVAKAFPLGWWKRGLNMFSGLLSPYLYRDWPARLRPLSNDKTKTPA